jgi:hypothetical protein
MTYSDSLHRIKRNTNPTFWNAEDIEHYNNIVNAIEKQIPKKPIHTHEEYEKHDWKKRADGTVDDFAWESDYHNGVICNRCSETICVYCCEDYDKEAGKCVVDEHYCPNCERHAFKKDFCRFCGQALDWSDTK